jgi:subtilisin family serine protease
MIAVASRSTGLALLLLALLWASGAWAEKESRFEPFILDIDVESVNPSDSLGEVIGALHRAGLLPPEKLRDLQVKYYEYLEDPETGGKGYLTAEDILRAEYQLPAVTPKLKRALERLNPDLGDGGLDTLGMEDVIKVPSGLKRIPVVRVFSLDERVEYERLARSLPAALQRTLNPFVPGQAGSIVRIRAPGLNPAESPFGSGFIVEGFNELQYVVTATHVLVPRNADEQSLSECVALPQGTKIVGIGSGADELRYRCAYHLGSDVSLIELVETGHSTLPIAARVLNAFEPVSLAGYPRSGGLRINAGFAHGTHVASIFSESGMSGGPYLDSDGVVVGIHQGQNPSGDLARMIPIMDVRNALSQYLPSVPIWQPEPFLKLSFWGYNIRVQTNNAEAASRAFAALWHLETLGVRPSLALADSVDEVPHFAGSTTPTVYWDKCRSGQASDSDAPYSALLPWLADWSSAQLPAACFEETGWPELVILDQLVFPHAELKDSVIYRQNQPMDNAFPAMAAPEVADLFKQIEGIATDNTFKLTGEPLAVGADDKYSCNKRDFDERFDHGTHLAGIISSRKDLPGFSGIFPGLKLVSIPVSFPQDVPQPRRSLTYNEFKALVQALWRESENAAAKQRIMLYASRFPPDANAEGQTSEIGGLSPNYPKSVWPDPGGMLASTETRWEHRVAAMVRKDIEALWIVAAGQDETKGGGPRHPIALSPRTPQTPQNLGDRPNVVVVTACAECGPPAKLWDDANTAVYPPAVEGAPSAVTLAAPGVRIPGPVVGASYAEASGTSQAAAFVAGVAAAMYSCNPGQYMNAPERLKQQLVLTGQPYLMREKGQEQSWNEVSPIVIVDPRLAIRSPAQDWLIEGSFAADYDGIVTGEPKVVDIKGWCLGELRISDALDKERDLAVEDIRRLLRWKNKWVAYRSDTGEPFGPFTLLISDPQTKMLSTADEIISLGTLGDVYLRSPLGKTSCPDS